MQRWCRGGSEFTGAGAHADVEVQTSTRGAEVLRAGGAESTKALSTGNFFWVHFWTFRMSPNLWPPGFSTGRRFLFSPFFDFLYVTAYLGHEGFPQAARVQYPKIDTIISYLYYYYYLTPYPSSIQPCWTMILMTMTVLSSIAVH